MWEHIDHLFLTGIIYSCLVIAVHACRASHGPFITQAATSCSLSRTHVARDGFTCTPIPGWGRLASLYTSIFRRHPLFAWLISHGWKYCWLICRERKILFIGWKSTAYKPNEQGDCFKLNAARLCVGVKCLAQGVWIEVVRTQPAEMLVMFSINVYLETRMPAKVSVTKL